MQHDSTIYNYFEVDYKIRGTLNDVHLLYLCSQFNGLYRHFFTLTNL